MCNYHIFCSAMKMVVAGACCSEIVEDLNIPWSSLSVEYNKAYTVTVVSSVVPRVSDTKDYS